MDAEDLKDIKQELYEKTFGYDDWNLGYETALDDFEEAILELLKRGEQ